MDFVDCICTASTCTVCILWQVSKIWLYVRLNLASKQSCDDLRVGWHEANWSKGSYLRRGFTWFREPGNMCVTHVSLEHLTGASLEVPVEHVTEGSADAS